MLKLKTKWFSKWAKKNRVGDDKLITALSNINNELGTSELGSGLYKVRIPKTGRGKSSGFRSIVVFRKFDIAIFVYGFAKNEKNTLDKDELNYFKKLSVNLLSIDRKKFNEMKISGDFISLKEK